MIGHSAIVIFIALLAGWGLAMSLIGGFEIFPGNILSFEIPGDSSAWARAHTGGLLNGLLVLAIAWVLSTLDLNERKSFHIWWMIIGTAYANTVFYWAGILAPNRAITAGSNRLGDASLAGVIGFLPAAVFALVLMVAMVMIARAAFSKDN
tara:strand:+ start:897 stop:1349 length:453 start_codon:yes stop_codon:yes gene_type:complete